MRLAVLTLLLGALLAACGGSSATVRDVPGPPVTLDEPGNAAELAPNVTATPTATASPTPTATATAGTTSSGTPDAGSSGTTPSTASPSGSTGASATPPPPGSDAQKFEQFCAQNPGAC